MDTSKLYAPGQADVTDQAQIEGGFDFEIEDVNELDIFTPLVMCSSTTSSSSCCA